MAASRTVDDNGHALDARSRGPLRALERLTAANAPVAEIERRAMDVVQACVPWQVAILSRVDPATGLFTSCHNFGVPADPERERRFFRHELTEDDPGRFLDLARRTPPVWSLRRSLADPFECRRYRDLLAPLGCHDELRASLLADEAFVGTLVIYRMAPPDFDDAELALLAELAPALGMLLRIAQARHEATVDGDLAPGVLTLDADNRVLVQSGSARHALGDLGGTSALPSVAQAVAAAARHPDPERPARARAQGRSGAWWSLYGALAEGSEPGLVMLVLAPVRPHELADVVVQAWGLSAREREVVEHVSRGLDTKQIASALEISEYTVQDHLKRVFDKSGVRSRAELVWELFNRFYLPYWRVTVR